MKTPSMPAEGPIALSCRDRWRSTWARNAIWLGVEVLA